MVYSFECCILLVLRRLYLVAYLLVRSRPSWFLACIASLVRYRRPCSSMYSVKNNNLVQGYLLVNELSDTGLDKPVAAFSSVLHNFHGIQQVTITRGCITRLRCKKSF